MNGLLLDTHILLWSALEPGKLSTRARAEIEAAGQLYVSAITVYEVVYLATDGRVKLAFEPQLWFQTTAARLDLAVLPVTAEIAALGAALASYPSGDPADRMIVGTAIHLNLPLCTADRQMRRFHKDRSEHPPFVLVW